MVTTCVLCQGTEGPFIEVGEGGDEVLCPSCHAETFMDSPLDDVLAELTSYVVFPSPEAAHAVALFIAATHAQPCWEHASRLVVKSPLKRCGKTRLIGDVVGNLVHAPIRTTNISAAALARSISEQDPPTLILDEADTIFTRKSRNDGDSGAEDLRGIVNAGHSRGWPYIRWDMKNNRAEQCPTFSMAVIGGIGDMPDTIEDRAVVITMRRRTAGETVRQFRGRRSIPELHELREQLREWLTSPVAVETLSVAEPDIPVEDRAADVWEPLVAVADLAGGIWPAAARHACRQLTEVEAGDEATLVERLLADTRTIFRDDAQLLTGDLLDRLHHIEDAPWGDFYGKPLSAPKLAQMLKRFGIGSQNLRNGGRQGKGYMVAAFEDAWSRYLPPVTTSNGQAPLHDVPGTVDAPPPSQPSRRPNPTEPVEPQDDKVGRHKTPLPSQAVPPTPQPDTSSGKDALCSACGFAKGRHAHNCKSKGDVAL